MFSNGPVNEWCFWIIRECEDSAGKTKDYIIQLNPMLADDICLLAIQDTDVSTAVIVQREPAVTEGFQFKIKHVEGKYYRIIPSDAAYIYLTAGFGNSD